MEEASDQPRSFDSITRPWQVGGELKEQSSLWNRLLGIPNTDRPSQSAQVQEAQEMPCESEGADMTLNLMVCPWTDPGRRRRGLMGPIIIRTRILKCPPADLGMAHTMSIPTCLNRKETKGMLFRGPPGGPCGCFSWH